MGTTRCPKESVGLNAERIKRPIPIQHSGLPKLRRYSCSEFIPLRRLRQPFSFVESGYFLPIPAIGRLSQGEAAEGVFADASEIECVVAFDHVGDLSVAVRGVVLKVVGHAAAGVEAEDE